MRLRGFDPNYRNHMTAKLANIVIRSQPLILIPQRHIKTLPSSQFCSQFWVVCDQKLPTKLSPDKVAAGGSPYLQDNG